MIIERLALPANVFLEVKRHSRLDLRNIIIIELLLITICPCTPFHIISRQHLSHIHSLRNTTFYFDYLLAVWAVSNSSLSISGFLWKYEMSFSTLLWRRSFELTKESPRRV